MKEIDKIFKTWHDGRLENNEIMDAEVAFKTGYSLAFSRCEAENIVLRTRAVGLVKRLHRKYCLALKRLRCCKISIDLTECPYLGERILHAAIKSESGWIIFGKSHTDCFYKAYWLNIKTSIKGEDRGFLTNRGRFVGRKEAAKIALAASQIKNPTDILFSEELWSIEYGGMQSYCEIAGYKPTTKTSEG